MDLLNRLSGGQLAKNYVKAHSRYDEVQHFLNKLNNLIDNGTKELDIAISAEGKQEVLDALKESMVDGVRDLLNCDKQFKDILEYVWKGEDKEQFVQNFDKKKEEALSRIEEYYQQLVKELDRIEKEWEDFRATNVAAE